MKNSCVCFIYLFVKVVGSFVVHYILYSPRSYIALDG